MKINKGLRFALAVVAGSVVAVATVAVASAHAHYDSSTPTKGQVLQTAPASVVINFAEDIETTAGSYGVTVEKDGGGSVTSGAATVSGDAQLTVQLQSGLGAGRYVVNWHNVSSDDGDAAEGAFSFYIQTQPTAADLAKDEELTHVGEEEEATPTAEAASPTAKATELAAPTAAAAPTEVPPLIAPAPTGGALPATGTGASGTDSNSAIWLVLALFVATGGVATTLVARKLRRR
jgi:methionine-rich copper-binding protein CopC